MNEFNSDNNKAMLWTLMDKQGKFNNIPANINISTLFESSIKQIEIKCTGKESLVNMNKSFLSAMIKSLSIYTSPSVLKKNKTEMFNNSLQEKEQSFKDMMKVPAPATVDFRDADEPIANIDDLLSKQLEKRNLDMPSYGNIDETSVKEWLTGESSNLPPSKPKNPDVHIKIGELVNQNSVLDITPIKKTVQWSDNNNSKNSTSDIMPSISTSDDIISEVDNSSEAIGSEIPNDNDVRTSLLKILKNQEYIINAIHDLQDRF
jgi:hypothetical protein